MESSAVISADGIYRYWLERAWDDSLPNCLFVMLNPSTADALQDDPTIRRCINFAKAFGCGSLEVINLYAYRATDPAELWKTEDPVGPENEAWWWKALNSLDGPLIAAWGANAKPIHAQRFMYIAANCGPMALGINKDGSPKHPLYLSKSSVPTPFSI